MDKQRFDRLTTVLASRLSRRAAFRGLGGGVAATGLAGVAPMQAGAQESTPAATPRGDGEDRTYFLFVQTAQGGTWTPKADEDGIYTLTLAAIPDQTVYFSDRPERIVGAVPVQEFLDSLGFTPDNPPNAALVARTDAGADVLVIELLNPAYDAAAGTLTYDARVLENYQEEGLAFLADRRGDLTMPERFEHASLFIDDCSDQTMYCYTDCRNYPVGNLGSHGMCWSWYPVGCEPCGDGWVNIADQCNETFPDLCNGNCVTDC